MQYWGNTLTIFFAILMRLCCPLCRILSQSFQSVCQKSRTLYISLLNVNQSLKNPNILSGLKLKILPLRWGFFFDPFFLQLSNAQRLPGVGEGGGVPVTSALGRGGAMGALLLWIVPGRCSIPEERFSHFSFLFCFYFFWEWTTVGYIFNSLPQLMWCGQKRDEKCVSLFRN